MKLHVPDVLPLAAAAALAITAPAQVQDVGLTLDGGVLTVIYGQACGPVSCSPMVGGPIAGGQARMLTQYSAPQTLYAVAVGVPGACLPLPGFGNSLLLQNPFVLSWGVMPTPPFAPIPCQQTFFAVPLMLPAGTPAGIALRLQSVGVSPSTGQFAFGPAIDVTTV